MLFHSFGDMMKKNTIYWYICIIIIQMHSNWKCFVISKRSGIEVFFKVNFAIKKSRKIYFNLS